MNADVAPSTDSAAAAVAVVAVAVADAVGSCSDLSASIKLVPIDAVAVHSINHKAIYPN